MMLPILVHFISHLLAHLSSPMISSLVDYNRVNLIPTYPQFVQEAHRLLKTSCARAKEYLQAQHLHQQQVHDNISVAEFQVADRVWLYTPVV